MDNSCSSVCAQWQVFGLSRANLDDELIRY